MLDKAYRRFHQAMNYRLGRFLAGRFAHHARPTYIALLLTKQCNARCIHCNLWKGPETEANWGQNEWLSLLVDLRHWLGPVHVVLTGGEALLRPFTPELLARGGSLGLFMELLTNGYSNDPALIDRIAMANPGRITISVDGIGASHSQIRGRRDFWDHTRDSVESLCRLRRDRKLNYDILLKCVIMRQNLANAADVAHFAREQGVAVRYQPVEQNYGTAEDPHWFEQAPTWPDNCDEAVRTIEELISLKGRGYPILNSRRQLEVMIPYFRDPATSQETVRAHTAHEERPPCAAVSVLQVEPDGSVTICCRRPQIGSLSTQPIREIWRNRPRWWQGEGCGIDTFCPSDPRR